MISNRSTCKQREEGISYNENYKYDFLRRKHNSGNIKDAGSGNLTWEKPWQLLLILVSFVRYLKQQIPLTTRKIVI